MQNGMGTCKTVQQHEEWQSSVQNGVEACGAAHVQMRDEINNKIRQSYEKTFELRMQYGTMASGSISVVDERCRE